MAAKKSQSGKAGRVAAQGEKHLPERAEGQSAPETQSPSEAKGSRFPIVGIGASAGGLGALKEFLEAMPATAGMAFVIIQHLEPRSESRMAEILGKCTAMKVVQAGDGMAVEPNAVYTNPPGRTLSLREGRLVVGPMTERGHVLGAIDHFLASLADEQGSRAICIVLSGSSGSDGPRGVRAVRAAGGMCMAQEPGSAQFAAMPQTIIDTGLTDYILPPSEMPAVLLKYTQHPQVLAAGRVETPTGTTAGDVEAILKLLHTRTGSDYRHYKRATVFRRIQRRMGLRQIADLRDYIGLLQKDNAELQQLAKDMLIGVSSFFRDGEAFELLHSAVVVPLIRAKEDDALLRAWVPGCATGEEAYSVAMILLEARLAAGKVCPVQVFATDIDEGALETARAGVYPLSIAEDVPSHRLDAFFTQQGQTYHVTKQLREAVYFSRHNLLADPPFSKLDLITCRNVLIYIESEAQKKVLSVFSFALNVGGCLLLGKSEGVGGMDEIFEPISKSNRLYRLVRSNRRRAAGGFPLYTTGRPVGALDRDRERSIGEASILPQANLEAILRHFGACAVLTDPVGKILYFHGPTEKYLGHPKGPASLNILDMTAGTLSAKLRRAIDKALGQDEPVVLREVPLLQGQSSLANLTVMRVADRIGGRLLAIIFEDARPSLPAAEAHAVPAEDEPLLAQLEAEVKTLRNELRTNAEGYDTATEELKAANEEVISMNEELQSANEELEASKEELQSVNEELTTVNSQLNEKVGELTEINNDLSNLMGATEIAIIFLDGQLQIRRFTPSATGLLNLIESDVGRPIGHITQNFTGIDLAADAKNVLQSLTPMEKEVQAGNGRWYTLRILPYRTQDDRIDGVVVTFSDVTRLEEIEEHLRYEKIYAEKITQTVRHPLLVLDDKLQVLLANQAFYETFRVDPEQTIGRKLVKLGDGHWDIPQLRKLLDEVIPRESSFQDYRVEYVFEQIGRKVMLLSGRRIEPTGDMPQRLVLTIEDVTEREEARVKLESLAAELEKRVQERTAELAQAITSLESEVRERLVVNEQLEQRIQQLRVLSMKLNKAEQQERKRLAHILHDDLQQLLVGVKYHVGSLCSRAKDQPILREDLQKVESLMVQAIEVTRSLAVDLSAAALSDRGLVAALKWLGLEMKKIHGLSVHVTGDREIPADAEGGTLLLFRAVRELLLNIVKHAGVKDAAVHVCHLEGNQVQIEVSDNGAGFDPHAPEQENSPAKGLGLFSIQERLSYIGGRMEVHSAVRKGTRVILVAQIKPPETSGVPKRE